MECMILDENMIKIVVSVLAVTAFLYKCKKKPLAGKNWKKILPKNS